MTPRADLNAEAPGPRGAIPADNGYLSQHLDVNVNTGVVTYYDASTPPSVSHQGGVQVGTKLHQ